jgi:hypothetical protein
MKGGDTFPPPNIPGGVGVYIYESDTTFKKLNINVCGTRNFQHICT